MQEKTKFINLASDFSATPFGRYKDDGKFHGARFRTEHLVDAMNNYDTIVIDLTGVKSMGSSFMEESFGGLISEGFEPSTINKKIKFISKNEDWLLEINDYIMNSVRLQVQQ